MCTNNHSLHQSFEQYQITAPSLSDPPILQPDTLTSALVQTDVILPVDDGPKIVSRTRWIRTPRTAYSAACVIAYEFEQAGLEFALVPIFESGATREWSDVDRTLEAVEAATDYEGAIGVGDVSGNFLALDPDSPEAETKLISLAGDRIGFSTAGTRGDHRIFERGKVIPPEYRANHAQEFDRKTGEPIHSDEVLDPKLDIVTGLVTLWRTDKTWVTWPTDIEPMPEKLCEAVEACYLARLERKTKEEQDARQLQREARERIEARKASDDFDADQEERRARAWGDQALTGRASDIARLVDGQSRWNAIHKGAVYLSRKSLAAYISPDEIEAVLLDAAEACGYIADHGQASALRHIRNGIKWGLAHPDADLGLEDRPLPESFAGGRQRDGAGRESPEICAKLNVALRMWDTISHAQQIEVLKDLYRANDHKIHVLALRSQVLILRALLRQSAQAGRLRIFASFKSIEAETHKGDDAIRGMRNRIEHSGLMAAVSPNDGGATVWGWYESGIDALIEAMGVFMSLSPGTTANHKEGSLTTLGASPHDVDMQEGGGQGHKYENPATARISPPLAILGAAYPGRPEELPDWYPPV